MGTLSTGRSSGNGKLDEAILVAVVFVTITAPNMVINFGSTICPAIKTADTILVWAARLGFNFDQALGDFNSIHRLQLHGVKLTFRNVDRFCAGYSLSAR